MNSAARIFNVFHVNHGNSLVFSVNALSAFQAQEYVNSCTFLDSFKFKVLNKQLNSKLMIINLFIIECI